MVLTAVAMAFQLDVRFQTAIAKHLPAAVVNPTESLENSAGAKRELAKLRGKSRFEAAKTAVTAAAGSEVPALSPDSPTAGAPGTPSSLPVLGTAPEFVGNQKWFNTPGGKPLTLKSLRGRVVLIDFWTYTCINCIRTLPHVTAWDAKYREAGLTIVGVHSPEFDFEKNAGNVAAAIKQNGIHYPVAQDNDLATWGAWGNQYWPAEYLIDAQGRVRETHFGEGDYDKSEESIRSLLEERGAGNLGGDSRPSKNFDPAFEASPETYVGTARATGFTGAGTPRDGRHTYPAAAGKLPLSTFALSGTWITDKEHAVAGPGARLTSQVQGKDVYLVMSPPSPSQGGTVTVLLDGAPISAAKSGADVHGGRVTVASQRLYHLVHAGSAERHRLELRFGSGVSAFAFTFG